MTSKYWKAYHEFETAIRGAIERYCAKCNDGDLCVTAGLTRELVEFAFSKHITALSLLRGVAFQADTKEGRTATTSWTAFQVNCWKAMTPTRPASRDQTEQAATISPALRVGEGHP